MNIPLDDIHQLVRRQNEWRGSETLNLIASENVQSPAVREIENNDFMGRYAEGHPNTSDCDHRYYEGTHYIDEIESLATSEMKELAKCRQADVRPISGNAANTALTLGILKGGDSVIVNSIKSVCTFRIPFSIFGEGCAKYFSVMSVTRLVFGVTIERIVRNQSITNYFAGVLRHDWRSF